MEIVFSPAWTTKTVSFHDGARMCTGASLEKATGSVGIPKGLVFSFESPFKS
jgi:hypothetical protein